MCWSQCWHSPTWAQDTGFLTFHHVLSPSTASLGFLLISSYPVINHLLLEGPFFKSLRLDLEPATSAKSECFKMALMKFWASCVQENKRAIMTFKSQYWVILKQIQNFGRQGFKKCNHGYILGAFSLPAHGWAIKCKVSLISWLKKHGPLCSPEGCQQRLERISISTASVHSPFIKTMQPSGRTVFRYLPMHYMKSRHKVRIWGNTFKNTQMTWGTLFSLQLWTN